MGNFSRIVYSFAVVLIFVGCIWKNFLYISPDRNIKVYESHGSCYLEVNNDVYDVSIKTNNPTDHYFRVCISFEGRSDNFECISVSTPDVGNAEIIAFNSDWMPIRYEKIDSTASVVPAIISILNYFVAKGHGADTAYHTIIFVEAAGDIPQYIHVWLDAEGQCWEWISLGNLFKISYQNVGGVSVITRTPQGATRPGMIITRKLGQDYISEIHNSMSVFDTVKPTIAGSIQGTIGYDVDKAIFDYFENKYISQGKSVFGGG